jgi:hypothetical protein
MPCLCPKMYKSPCPCGTPPPMKMGSRWVTLYPRSECAEVGLCPGNHQSAGKQLRGTTRKGDRWLRQALIEAAQGAMRTKDTYLSAQGQRLTHRRGKKRAVVAVAHTILIIAYHVLQRQQPSQDLGSNYFDERERSAIARQSVRRLEQLGGTRDAGNLRGGGMSQEASPPLRNRSSIFRESRAKPTVGTDGPGASQQQTESEKLTGHLALKHDRAYFIELSQGKVRYQDL